MPYYTGLARVARAAGLDVIEVAGWRTRGHGPMSAAQSVMWHHTAGAATGDYPSLRVVRDGHGGLPGPLAQYGLGRSGRVYVIAAGLCYHAGRVSHARYTNPRSIGIEAENTGTGQVWPKVQLDAYHALTAALCAEFGWNPAIAVIGHKEAARPAGRKIDPTGINMNTVRTTVAGLMRGTPVPTPPAQEEEDVPLTDDDIRRIWTHTHPTQMTTTDMRGFAVSTYRKVAEVEAAQAGLVGAIVAMGKGEPFNEAKLLDGVRKAARDGVAEAIDSIDTTVTIKGD
ncbi:peptidoglycan recognition protein family protein [Pseudactinotalea sp. Z1748]|uniref:peptidoglycan recognition protein family protein n=1 Tax=Pseudactinotalea sp. Z1748 TaxID=3413027 RepID=UPI003C7A81C3